ncbi:ribosomal protein [Coemansia spiralis]|uniref:Ribosomal protein n=2 Tax=Coemansia TaxID=4863 RepID=A0A9W8L0W0_9FUNG|nr:ribosomal protein L5 domain-containing protein [Coemansia spiralis]KAJ1988384.1 ribosomal protein [Coemansia umbellata]KAJ2621085.1 ribosomal protein [Coemansia sp. RSA 1358]KAJ2680201.1 ribosomal protein [Coemansia spiralis]
MFGVKSMRSAVASTASKRLFATSIAQAYQTRLNQFFHNTLRDDLMILQYVPPSVRARQGAAEETRMKEAKESMGGTPPNPLRKHKQIRRPKPNVPVPTAHNTPFVDKVTVHIRCREALQNKHHLLSALMALQILTGERGEVLKAKNDAAAWKLRKGMPISAKVELTGDNMYEFLDKLIEVVLPRMKEYHGLKMSAGDGVGNFTLGFDSSVIGLFPEMEVVYDMFPLVTGFSVNIKTTAVRNPTGRLLLSGFGLPFLHARKPKSETFDL